MLDVQKHYDEKIPIGDGAVLAITIKRFTLGEHTAFMRAYDANKLAAKRLDLLRHRLQTSDDQVPVDTPTESEAIPEPVYDLLATQARLELDDAPMAERLATERRRLDDSNTETWRDAFAAFVRVPAGQIPGIEEETDGSVILETWPNRRDVFNRVYSMVLAVNTLSAAAKNALASALDSGSSSPAPSPTPRGDAPATTADSADANSSASPEAVTDPRPVDEPSGALALSS